MKMARNISVSLLLGSLVLVFLVGVSSAEKKETKITKKTEIFQLNGELGFVSKDFISITYVADGMEYEMVFYLPKNLTIEHKDTLKNINSGDRISIEYTLITETTEKGQEIRRIANKVTYLGPKITGLRSQ
jgi:hypothetical protein